MVKYTRLAQLRDVDRIVVILNDAKKFLKKSGSPQWQSGYPNRETIVEDVQAHHGYVLVVGDRVAAYAAVIVGEEPTYREIEGAWQNPNDPYATVHRICVSADYQGQGLAKTFYSDIITLFYAQGVRNFRVDTYRLNQPMQKLAKDNGYVYRGIIKVDDPVDPERLAFELNFGQDE